MSFNSDFGCCLRASDIAVDRWLLVDGPKEWDGRRHC